MSRCLITGGAGFIGSNIAEYLIRHGHYVRILDNFHSGKLENLQFAQHLSSNEYQLIHGDITNPADCDTACQNIDFVFHEAALTSVPKSLADPLKYNRINIDGVLCMLQAAAKHKVKRFVFASSSSVYGDSQIFPQKEDHFPLLMSPYALSKLAGEYYCRIFSDFFALETVCLRYFNVFGPKQALDDEYAVVIPKFIRCILNDENPPIFGTGLQSRDFTYIENVVSANVLAATAPGIKHEVFNVAHGSEQSILELVAALNRIIGKNVQPKLLPVRAGDIYRSSADISKISRMVNYKPLIGFEEGLRKTAEYFKEKWSKQ